MTKEKPFDLARPTLSDIYQINLKSNYSIEHEDADSLLKHYSEFQNLLKPYSRTINSHEEMLNFCINHDFSGTKGTPYDNAEYLWLHESAHHDAAKRLLVDSEIKIAELLEPKHSKFVAYLSVNIPSLISATNNTPSKIFQYFGEITLEANLKGVGYEAETLSAKKTLYRSQIMGLKEKFQAKKSIDK